MRPVKGMPWDFEWSPLDFDGLLSLPDERFSPFSFVPGGCCRSCGSRDLRGLKVLVKPAMDVFGPEVRHYDRAAVFAIMAAAPWHDFMLPSEYPEELTLWHFARISNNGECGYAKNDVGDALSDRWSRFMPDATDHSAARRFLGEACRAQMEHTLKWPLENVDFFVPGNDPESLVLGYKLWLPTLKDRTTAETIKRE